jgi:hypothetical protein
MRGDAPGDRWAMGQLSASGEDVEGRLRLPQYLLLARTLLLPPAGALMMLWPPCATGKRPSLQPILHAAGNTLAVNYLAQMSWSPHRRASRGDSGVSIPAGGRHLGSQHQRQCSACMPGCN